jgi:hypothetical protein
LIRLTIKDPEQIVSFLTDEERMLCFVAGCSINPVNLGELLMATETYLRGVTASIMSELIEFDKTLRSKGPSFIHEAISSAQAQRKALEITFQVIDGRTEREALVPRECDLVVLDLTQHNIVASESLDIPFSDEVHIYNGQIRTNKTVTYILPQNWTVEPVTG